MNEFWLGVTLGVLGILIFSAVVSLLMARWIAASSAAIEEQPLQRPVSALNGHYRRELPAKEARL